MTLDRESLLNLAVDEVAVAEFLDDRGGYIIRDDRVAEGGDPSIYWLTLRPRTAPDEMYFSRYQWFTYPYEPASITIVDRIRGSSQVRTAWPIIVGYRPDSFDICRPFCREGYQLHAEWQEGSTAWRTEGNPFLSVVQTMQDQFDNEYQGRVS